MNSRVISSADLTVADLFRDFYVVPDYQREFVWTTDDVERLLQDIYGAFGQPAGNQDPYFIGTTVTTYMQDRKLYELIDGQQRTTTLYITLIAIRDLLSEQNDFLKTIDGLLFALAVDQDGNETPRYRIELQYGDGQELLIKLASPRNDTPISDLEPTSQSSKNILSAYKACIAFLAQNLTDGANLRRFFAYLTQKVIAIRVQTDSIDRALHIFETINARGQGLNAMDLLKNLLFRQAQSDAYEQLKTVWKALADTLEGASERPMVFIRYYLLAHHAEKPIRADELYNWLINTNNIDRPRFEADPLGFAHKLLDAANAYTRFSSGRLKDGTPSTHLENIRHASRTARQHLIILMAARHLPPESFSELANQLELLIFVFVITRQPANRYENTFVEWASRIRRIESKTELRRFIENEIFARKQELAEQFTVSLHQLRSNRVPQYRLKYLLARLTQYVDEIAYKNSSLQTYLDRKTEIEHILPHQIDPTALEGLGGEAEAKDLTTRLGNLALLEKPLNAVASNRNYDKKLEIYAKSRFLLTRSLTQNAAIGMNTSVNLALKNLPPYAHWNAESILDRENRLVQLAQQIWLSDQTAARASDEDE